MLVDYSGLPQPCKTRPQEARHPEFRGNSLLGAGVKGRVSLGKGSRTILFYIMAAPVMLVHIRSSMFSVTLLATPSPPSPPSLDASLHPRLIYSLTRIVRGTLQTSSRSLSLLLTMTVITREYLYTLSHWSLNSVDPLKQSVLEQSILDFESLYRKVSGPQS